MMPPRTELRMGMMMVNISPPFCLWLWRRIDRNHLRRGHEPIDMRNGRRGGENGSDLIGNPGIKEYMPAGEPVDLVQDRRQLRHQRGERPKDDGLQSA